MTQPRIRIYDVIIIPHYEGYQFMVIDIGDNYKTIDLLAFIEKSGKMEQFWHIYMPEDYQVIGYTLSPINNFCLKLERK